MSRTTSTLEVERYSGSRSEPTAQKTELEHSKSENHLKSEALSDKQSMKDQRSPSVVFLDGRSSDEEDLSPVLAILTGVLSQTGEAIQAFTLSEAKLTHCVGCFDCWVKTPGVCTYREPEARTILRAFVQSNTAVFFTPVVFGGYSSQLKQIVDRLPSLLLPYFDTYHGEMHHRRRYAKYPRLVVVGVQRHDDAEEAGLFKLLVGRNALNLYSPSYAVEVITITDNPEKLRETFQSLVTREDAFPAVESIRSLFPVGEAPTSLPAPGSTRYACLIVGSPKIRSHSTSSVIGAHLLQRLTLDGWKTESVTLGPSLQTKQGRDALVAAVDKADLVLLVFPLYVDALPFFATRALELIADHRRHEDHRRPQGLVAIANNGFVESYQNNVVLSICQRFAKQTRMTWMGSLAMGAGEAIVGGRPLESKRTAGPPNAHVIQALDIAGDALARGEVVPAGAAREMARTPIPHVPFAIWRMLFTKSANRSWEEKAAKNGVSKQELLAQPYARKRR